MRSVDVECAHISVDFVLSGRFISASSSRWATWSVWSVCMLPSVAPVHSFSMFVCSLVHSCTTLVQCVCLWFVRVLCCVCVCVSVFCVRCNCGQKVRNSCRVFVLRTYVDLHWFS